MVNYIGIRPTRLSDVHTNNTVSDECRPLWRIYFYSEKSAKILQIKGYHREVYDVLTLNKVLLFRRGVDPKAASARNQILTP